MKEPIATIKNTRRIQEEHGVHTKKSFGQNFIIEPKVVEKIADAAIRSKDDLVIEVGPGIGALTQYLCEKADHVIAFEIDERLPEILYKEIGDEHLEIILQDFLEADIDKVIRERRKAGSGSISYPICLTILRRRSFSSFSKRRNIRIRSRSCCRRKSENAFWQRTVRNPTTISASLPSTAAM